MDAGPSEIARVITDTQKGEPILLAGPGASLLYEKLTAMSDANGATAQLDIKPGEQRWGNAETLLAIAQEARIIEQCNTDHSGGPEYRRGALG